MGLPKARVDDRSFELTALERVAAGESVSGVARALGLRRELLCEWRKVYRAGGAAALRGRGRPSAAAKAALARPSDDPLPGLPPPDEPTSARQRIEALERKIGRQALEPDFFAAAQSPGLLTERVDRAASGPRGEPASTTASAVGRSGKASRVSWRCARCSGSAGPATTGTGERRRQQRRRRLCATGCSSSRWRIGITAIVGSARCCDAKAGP
jgi:transposase